MRVNIVLGNGDTQWIGGRMARELVARLPAYGIDAAINTPGGADLTYHQIVYGEPDASPSVGLFTHGADRPTKHGIEYDGQICMNSAMLGYLHRAGANHAALIEQPVSDAFVRTAPIVFGVSGRIYGDGRKGEHLVAKMVEAGYVVKAWGHGWSCPIVSTRIEDLPAFYASLDYYIDTSSDEGGCTPALEAMAMGVPVISHTLGVDRPVLAYKTHDWDSLHQVLRALTVPRTYDNWARDHAAYFKSVLARMRASA